MNAPPFEMERRPTPGKDRTAQDYKVPALHFAFSTGARTRQQNSWEGPRHAQS